MRMNTGKKMSSRKKRNVWMGDKFNGLVDVIYFINVCRRVNNKYQLGLWDFMTLAFE